MQIFFVFILGLLNLSTHQAYASSWCRVNGSCTHGGRIDLVSNFVTRPLPAAINLPPKTDAILIINSKVRCRPTGLPLIAGLVFMQGQIIRFHLFEGAAETKINLGPIGSINDLHQQTISLQPSSDCALDLEFSAHVELSQVAPPGSLDFAALAMQHSPFIGVRHDQPVYVFSDLPLALSYSVLPVANSQNRILRYTLILTNEDLITPGYDIESLMVRYGRRHDIEWVYEVEFDTLGRIVARRYHRGFFDFRLQYDSYVTVAHATGTFSGPRAKYLKDPVTGQNTDHPILFMTGQQNVFNTSAHESDETNNPIGYHLTPSYVVNPHEARERTLFANPWMFRISDLELARERLSSVPSTQYLFVRINGELVNSPFYPIIQTSLGEIVTSGNLRTRNVDRMGEDLFNRESYSSVPLGSRRLSEIGYGRYRGSFFFRGDALSVLRLRTSHDAEPENRDSPSGFFPYRPLAFFRLVAVERDGIASYETVDLSSHFHCSYPESPLRGLRTRCEIQ